MSHYLDLTISNPTRAGIEYPGDWLAALSDPRSLTYEPTAAGLGSAREAVGAYYRQRGYSVDPDCVLLTAGTSEAYAFLFKLLANPGDEVLVPRPSYPLFEYLARLEGIATRPYGLHYDGRTWFTEKLVPSSHTRAVIDVAPNNPTGSVVSIDPAGLPLIVDEVFADYAFMPQRRLTGDFTLNGLSKIAGLPQMKLGWIVYPEAVRDALELIADTYLSVSAPVQYAAETWLARASEVQDQILKRVRANYDWLLQKANGTPITPLHIDGGWTVPIEIPKTRPEEDWVCDLLQHRGVLVQPGYFYDFPREAFIVVSLLTPTDIFQEGLERVIAFTG